jgi:hypothetical protein
MTELAHDQPTGYLLIALHNSMNNALSHLNTYGLLKTQYVQAQPVLQPTPDGSFIISQNRKPSSSQNTNFVISFPDPAAYALLQLWTHPYTSPYTRTSPYADNTTCTELNSISHLTREVSWTETTTNSSHTQK